MIIDVIIPAYSPSSIIRVGLMSLATQFHRELMNVVLVNDCSPNTENNYEDLIIEFKDLLRISCIKTPKNVGQGLARQYGIDHTFSEYFTFMDDDDQFGSNFAIFNLVSAIQASSQKHSEQQCALSMAPICNLHNKRITTIQVDNSVFVNGKLYNRKFINEYNIYFHPNHSFVGEDYYFSHAVFFALQCNADRWYEARVGDDPYAYFWMDNPSSQSQSHPYRTYLDMTRFAGVSVDLIKWMEIMKNNKVENIKRELCFIISHTYYHYFVWLEKIQKMDDPLFLKTFKSEDWEIMRNSINDLRELCIKYKLDKKMIQTFINSIKKEVDMQEYINKSNININIEEFIEKGTEELRTPGLYAPQSMVSA